MAKNTLPTQYSEQYIFNKSFYEDEFAIAVIVDQINGTMPLPTDAATLSEQQTQTTILNSILSTLGSPLTVTADTELPAAATLADATTNPSTTSVGSFMHLYNGTTWDRVRGDTTNGVDVDVTRVSGNVTVVNGGTFAVQAAQSGTWNITNITGTISLPTGAATLLEQQTQSTALNTIISTLLNSQDPTIAYKITDTDDASNPKYYGFTDKNENWYIMQENTVNKTYRYVKGSLSYTTNWNNRAIQTYDYFYNIF